MLDCERVPAVLYDVMLCTTRALCRRCCRRRRRVSCVLRLIVLCVCVCVCVFVCANVPAEQWQRVVASPTSQQTTTQHRFAECARARDTNRNRSGCVAPPVRHTQPNH